jgi:hypothetical protein
MFEQPLIKESTLIRMIELNPQLQSLCINTLEVTKKFLEQLIELPISLKRLSVYSCPLKLEDIQWFIEELNRKNQEMIVYTSVNELKNQPLIQKSDSWFMDEKLDIFSLWEMASGSSR